MRNPFKKKVKDEGDLSDTYLFDFKKGYNQDSSGSIAFGGNFVGGVTINGDGTVSSGSYQSKPPKLKIKPIDVLEELEKIPTPFSLNNLDDKISILEDKVELIKQKYTKREVKALIERLQNRKKYMKHKTFFDQFQNTNEESIEKLLDKYVLVMESSDLFIPEFPDDAISIMKKYTKIVKSISGKEPIYYVIGEEKDFKKKFEKRDPILLAQSPFGFFYQILGAWDKEMLLLSEL
jgi:hypothetical protein